MKLSALGLIGDYLEKDPLYQQEEKNLNKEIRGYRKESSWYQTVWKDLSKRQSFYQRLIQQHEDNYLHRHQ